MSGLFAGFFTKLGAIGGWVGSIIMGVIGAAVGMCVSTVVNRLIYGKSNTSITLLKFWLPFVKLSYDIDIGEKLGSALGGFGGGMMGGAAGVALATGLGYAAGLA